MNDESPLGDDEIGGLYLLPGKYFTPHYGHKDSSLMDNEPSGYLMTIRDP